MEEYKCISIASAHHFDIAIMKENVHECMGVEELVTVYKTHAQGRFDCPHFNTSL